MAEIVDICLPLIKLCPLWSSFGFGLFAIKHIVHNGKQFSGISITADQLSYDFMRKGVGMAPGTDPHADITVGPHRSPVIKAGFSVELPAQRTVHFRGFVHRNGMGLRSE